WPHLMQPSTARISAQAFSHGWPGQGPAITMAKPCHPGTALASYPGSQKAFRFVMAADMQRGIPGRRSGDAPVRLNARCSKRRSLRQRSGAVAFELLPDFVRQALNGGEVDCSRDRGGLVFLESEDARLLPGKIDRIS